MKLQKVPTDTLLNAAQEEAKSNQQTSPDTDGNQVTIQQVSEAAPTLPQEPKPSIPDGSTGSKRKSGPSKEKGKGTNTNKEPQRVMQILVKCSVGEFKVISSAAERIGSTRNRFLVECALSTTAKIMERSDMLLSVRIAQAFEKLSNRKEGREVN